MVKCSEFILVLFFVKNVLGFPENNYLSSLQRSRRQIPGDPNCEPDKQWKCENGEEISCLKLCDGFLDCSDGSDETVKACRSFFCKPNTFRCAYGGCVEAHFECDGSPQCVDNSDEETPNCKDFVKTVKKSGTCEPGQFQCKSGECIHDDQVCNGNGNCIDYSDETEEECSAHYCPDTNFQCEYGACILEAQRCDGIADCVDGSDERSDFCGSTNVLSISTTHKPRPTSNRNNPTYPVVQPSVGGFGYPVDLSSNDKPSKVSETRILLYKLQMNYLRSQYEILKYLVGLEEDSGFLEGKVTPNLGDSNRKGSSGKQKQKPIPSRMSQDDCPIPVIPRGKAVDLQGVEVDRGYVENGELITIECLGDASLIGVNPAYCVNGEFIPELAKCENQCSSLPLNTLSVQATCHNQNGETIPCTPFLPPKTVALLSCKVGYRKPDRVVKDAITCLEDGTWDSHVFKCEQVCGIISDGSANVIGGFTTNITKVPWHAAIYENRNGKMEQICGGSIINPTAIVTAAHCFWDPRRQKLSDSSKYVVVVGKTLRDFSADEPLTQVLDIKSIDVVDQYQDFNGLYVSDIAVLTLRKPIIFHSHIKPICIEYNLKNNERYVQSGIEGRVAGWGLTTSGGEPSPVLKVIDLPTVDYNTCVKESPPEFRLFITSDKYCAGFTSGESVCVGDSGGGMALKRDFPDKTSAYYLKGLVSTGPRKDGSCDNNKYSAFTDIHLNINLLYKYIANP